MKINKGQEEYKMIEAKSKNILPWDNESWIQINSKSIRNTGALLHALNLETPMSKTPDFPLRVPEPYLKKIRKNDRFDPLLLQILPTDAETVVSANYVSDPLQELKQMPKPGIIHKYPGRVLFVVTGSCAVHCRYCFRRHFPYKTLSAARHGWDTLDQYLFDNPNISEVILSGGDPLSLKTSLLAEFSEMILRHKTIKRLRIHTRFPVVIPQRINEEFLQWIDALPLKPVMVLHCNHPNEIDQDFILAMQALRHAGVTLLNQTVLLRGVNDRANLLISLSESLWESGVLPYYLHLLDPVLGAAHFDVSQDDAQRLLRTVTDSLPGYLIPKLVREEPGKLSKTLITPCPSTH